MASPVTVVVGHMSLALTQSWIKTARPMLVQPPLDSPAVWTDTPRRQALTPTPCRRTAPRTSVTAVAAGADTVGLSVTIGGNTFTDSLLITIAAAPQVASGVVINSVVSSATRQGKARRGMAERGAARQARLSKARNYNKKYEYKCRQKVH